MNVKLFVNEQDIGQRLDTCLAQLLQGQYSRTQLQQFIKEGCVCVEGQIVKTANFKLKAASNIDISIPELREASLESENIALDILYEDNDIIVVNKPAGIVVHPGAGNINGTLANALLHHCQDSLSGIGGVKRPGIVHRLDKNTSGVMVVAKNDLAHVNLSNQFADHGKTGQLRRAYKALIWGRLEPAKGRIVTYLGRSSKDRTKRSVVKESAMGAKCAITHYKTLECFEEASLLECCLETGRTHQIRVHMAYKGAPLVGDSEYGAGFKSKSQKLSPDLQREVAKFERQALHAYYLQFTHPKSEKLMRFEVDMPLDMQNLLEGFRKKIL